MNSLDSGFYTIGDAADLIALDVVGVTHAKLRRMFEETKLYKPAVKSDRAIGGRVRDISFLDLIELRFISHFRNKGVSAQTIRLVAESARGLFGIHPFARKDITYKSDGRKLFAQAATESGDVRLLELVERQFEFDMIEEFLKSGLDWNAEKYAISWKPRAAEYQNIVIDPRSSFGMPSLEGRGIATSTIYDSWVAEDGNFDAVADWFDIAADEVKEAVRFQDELPN